MNRRPGEAKAIPSQRARPWPPDATEGFITFKGRTFHRGAECALYRQGIKNTAAAGGEPEPLEWVTAAEAGARQRGPCKACWPEGVRAPG